MFTVDVCKKCCIATRPVRRMDFPISYNICIYLFIYSILYILFSHIIYLFHVHKKKNPPKKKKWENKYKN